MNRILVLANNDVGLYNFRKELLQELIKIGYEVYISLPYGDKVPLLEEIGCTFIQTDVDRRGINPIRDFLLMDAYRKIMKKIKPHIVLTYTIKPNIYGGMLSSWMNIPYLANVTGLGVSMRKSKILFFIVQKLYKIAFKNINCLFFQNKENQMYFVENIMKLYRSILLPGSGVNIDQFFFMEYLKTERIEFVFIGRVMKDKGIEEYLAAAKFIKDKYVNTVFHVCGFCEENYKTKLDELHKQGIINYHGMVDDVRQIFKTTHCIVLPSYHEGMANVLLEAAACARPAIASDISGCREIIENGKTGFLCEAQNSAALIQVIEKFLKLTNEQRKEMGIEARKKVETKFDRKIVVNAYMNEINNILGEQKSESAISKNT